MYMKKHISTKLADDHLTVTTMTMGSIVRETSEVSCLSALPEEMLLHIISFVKMPPARALSATCRRLRALVSRRLASSAISCAACGHHIFFEADERHADVHVGPRPDDGDAVGVHAAAASVALGPRVRASQPLILTLVDALAGEAVDPAWDASMGRLSISRRVRFDFARRVSQLITLRRAHCPRCRRYLGLQLSLPPLHQRVEPTAQDMRPGVVDKGGRVRQLKNLADRCAAADAATLVSANAAAAAAAAELGHSPRAAQGPDGGGGSPASTAADSTDALVAAARRLTIDAPALGSDTTPGLERGFLSSSSEWSERTSGGWAESSSGHGRVGAGTTASPTMLHASLAHATAGCDGSLGCYLERIVEAAGRRSKARSPSALERRSWKEPPLLRFASHGQAEALLEEPAPARVEPAPARAHSADAAAPAAVSR